MIIKTKKEPPIFRWGILPNNQHREFSIAKKSQSEKGANTMGMLEKIVKEKNLAALELVAISLPYSRLFGIARDQGVDMDELEELLQEIS